MNSDSKAKDYSQWLDENEGILLLQDTGVVSERVPGDVKAHFGRNNIAVWGNVDEAHASVAVAAHQSWKMRQRFHHPSGRALGVELVRRGVVLRVVSVYCPSNLDNTSISEHNPRRRLANDLAREAIKWASQVDAFFIGGDFNETSRTEDRVKGGKGGKKRKSANKHFKNTVNGIMLDPCHGLADLYFESNGIKGIERGKGATRADCRGGEARLDYLFAPHQWLQRSSSIVCNVSQEFVSDHALVEAILEIPEDEVVMVTLQYLLPATPRESCLMLLPRRTGSCRNGELLL